MKYYFCPISKEENRTGVVLGKAFVYANKSRWVLAPDDIVDYLTAGYAKFTDMVVIDNKAYKILKTYIDLDQHCMIHVAVESSDACDGN